MKSCEKCFNRSNCMTSQRSQLPASNLIMNKNVENKAKSIIKRHKGTNWTEKETFALLEVSLDIKLTTLMDGKRFRHQEIYKLLEKKLAEKGILKTNEQIKIKLKKLRLSYYEFKKDTKPSGAGRKEIPFFDLLESLYGARPNVESNLQGIDTLELEDMSQNMTETEVSSATASTSSDAAAVIIENNIEMQTEQDSVDESIHEDTPTESIPKKKSSGRNTHANLLQNFANDLSKKHEYLQKEYLKQLRTMYVEEIRSQRVWESKLLKKQIKAQNRQTSKLIEALSGNGKKIQDNSSSDDTSSDDDFHMF